MVRAIVGANWGDEGKGKVTDLMAEQSDVVVRFQGGANAGHTIINEYGKFALHLIPSGVFYPHTTSIIGNGVAFNPEAFFRELQQLHDGGVPTPKILVSERAQLLMPYHILQDTYEEARLAGQAFGSTKSGIAPFYSDKFLKIGIQVSELWDETLLRERLDRVCEIKNVLFEHLYHQPKLEPEALFTQLMAWKEQLTPYVCDTRAFLREQLAAGKKVLLEGQLGSLKDPDWGIWPFTTSSSTVAGYGTVGAGIAPKDIEGVTVVTKAYSSAVGAGDFVSELFGDEAETLRRRGGDAGEYGATTGRPRRVGWFDAVATRYGVQVQGGTDVVLTAIDVLGYLDELKICVGYDIDGRIVRDFPVTRDLNRAKPVYATLPGWRCDVRGCTDWDKLPQEAKDYVLFIEKEIGVPIKIVSTGPKRHENIFR